MGQKRTKKKNLRDALNLVKLEEQKDRMEYFRKVRKRWEEKTDIWE